MNKKTKNIVSAEHKASGLENLSASMSPLIKKLLGNKGLIEIDLLTNWQNIVGQEIAEHSMPQKIVFKPNCRNDGTLHLLVAGSAFALEIQHNIPLILEKINTFFGYKAIAKITIMQNDEFINTSSSTVSEDKTDKKLVTKQEQTYINEVTEGVKSPELKARLKSLGESVFKNNK